MELLPTDFQLFQREHFSFKQLKEQLTPNELTKVKETYQQHWQKWKAIQLATTFLLPTDLAIKKPKVESWTNGWNLRNHFWSAYRSETRQDENACLAVLLNKNYYQVYLMFQHYQMDRHQGTVADFCNILEDISQWSQSIDATEYEIWPQTASEWEPHLLLATYLADPKVQAAFLEEVGTGSFQIGKRIKGPTQIANIEEFTAQTLIQLAPLYQSLAVK